MNRLPGGMLEDLLPHPLTIARRLAGGALTPEYWRLISSGRVAGQSHDELRLFLIKDNGPTVNPDHIADRPPEGVLLRGARHRWRTRDRSAQHAFQHQH
jgi:hypothetical protein